MRQWVLSVPFPLRFVLASQPAVMGYGAGSYLPHYRHAPDSQSGFYKTPRTNWCGDTHSALRWCAESKYTLPYVVSGRRVRIPAIMNTDSGSS